MRLQPNYPQGIKYRSEYHKPYLVYYSAIKAQTKSLRIMKPVGSGRVDMIQESLVIYYTYRLAHHNSRKRAVKISLFFHIIPDSYTSSLSRTCPMYVCPGIIYLIMDLAKASINVTYCILVKTFRSMADLQNQTITYFQLATTKLDRLNINGSNNNNKSPSKTLFWEMLSYLRPI